MDDGGTEGLKGSALFDGVSADTRTTLIGQARTRQLTAGTRLLSAGQVNRSLFIVTDGALDVHLPGNDGPHVRLQPGECVGELSVIDGQLASADVVAVSATSVLELPHDRVWALIDESALFARNLLRILAGRVRNDDAALTASTDRRRHYERLSMVDGLTALNNRRWLDAVFPPHLDRLRREERPVALLMADSDLFKALNDAHGHAVGDTVLRRIAIALTDGLRPDDLVARYGGEEFAALVADVDMTAALEVAERLRAGVERLEIPGGVRCTLSRGGAAASPPAAVDARGRPAGAARLRPKAAGG
jgi:diguanylate cyclase (GGDEF)-like protein